MEWIDTQLSYYAPLLLEVSRASRLDDNAGGAASVVSVDSLAFPIFMTL